MNPSILHLWLVHVPSIGCALGAILLLLNLRRAHKALSTIGLLILLLASSTSPILISSGEAYQWAIETIEPKPTERLEQIQAHATEAKRYLPASYLTSIISLLGLLSLALFPRFTKHLSILASLTAIATTVLFLLVASNAPSAQALPAKTTQS